MTSHPEAEASTHSLRNPVEQRVVWVIKPSTLCNLRCRYCYEWDHLANASRIALEDWTRIFAAVSVQREMQRARLRRSVWSHVVLQGGEPLLLPAGYLRAVAQMHDRMLGPNCLLSIQSNLVALSGGLLELLSGLGVAMGVSWDGVEGARLDLGGEPTHLRVLKNMRRLGDAGIPFGVNLVLGSHNHRLLPRIHDQILDLAAQWWAIHPVFRSTAPDSIEPYLLSPSEAANSLANLHRHWLLRGRAIRVQPLMRCERILRNRKFVPAPVLHPRIIVRPDLQVSLEGGTSSPTVIVGNLRYSRMRDLLESPKFETALHRLREQQPSPVESRLCELLRNAPTGGEGQSGPGGRYRGWWGRCPGERQ